MPCSEYDHSSVIASCNLVASTTTILSKRDYSPLAEEIKAKADKAAETELKLSNKRAR